MFLPASESAQPVPTVICGQGWKGKKGGVPGTPREQWGPYVLSSPGLRAPSQLVEPHYLILVRVRCAGEPGAPTQGVGPNRARGRDVGSQGPDCLLAIRREEESRRTWEVKIQGRRGKSPHLTFQASWQLRGRRVPTLSTQPLGGREGGAVVWALAAREWPQLSPAGFALL